MALGLTGLISSTRATNIYLVTLKSLTSDVNPDAVVTLAAATFRNNDPSPTFCFHGLDGLNVVTQDRKAVVLDSLAYVSGKDSNSVVAIGLRIKPVELVVATNDQIPCETLFKHLTDICSTLRMLSDTRFSSSSPPDVKLGEVSFKPGLQDEKLQDLYDDLLLQLYKYGYEKMQTKHVKRWGAIERFGHMYSSWGERMIHQHGTKCD